MVGRIVEIAVDNRHLSKVHGFLVVSEKGMEVGRVPFDGMSAVIGNAHGLTWSGSLVVELAQRSIPLVMCGANHRPAAFLWPADGHHNQAGRMAAQASVGTPLKKRLWQQIVRAKIDQQGGALESIGAPAGGFHLLARKVRSGDPDNIEAQAARRYWPLMFGKEFRRQTEANGINGLLNYAYAIVRAGAARSVMAAGLHPSLGIAHKNPSNPFCLVDDMMEPFRPVADVLVHGLVRQGHTQVMPESKRLLASVLTLDMAAANGASPVILCMERLAFSLSQCFSGEAKELELPKRPLPLVG